MAAFAPVDVGGHSAVGADVIGQGRHDDQQAEKQRQYNGKSPRALWYE